MNKVSEEMIQIGECNATDNPAVSEFFKDIYEELGWGITLSEGLDDPLGFFREHKGWLLVIKNKDSIVGTAGLVPLRDGNGLLKRFYIKKAYRGTDVSQMLLQKSLELAQQKRFKELFLDVRKDNIRAVGFWEKNGFTIFNPGQYEEWIETSYLPELRRFYKKVL